MRERERERERERGRKRIEEQELISNKRMGVNRSSRFSIGFSTLVFVNRRK